MPEQRSYTMQEILNGALNQPVQDQQQVPARSYSMQEILNGALDHPQSTSRVISPAEMASRRAVSRMQFEANTPNQVAPWAAAFGRAQELGEDLAKGAALTVQGLAGIPRGLIRDRAPGQVIYNTLAGIGQGAQALVSPIASAVQGQVPTPQQTANFITQGIPTAMAAEELAKTGGRALLRNRKPEEAAAVQFASDEGIPVRASTATGSPFLGSTEAVTQYMPFVGGRGAEFVERTREMLRQKGSELAARTGGQLPTREAVGGALDAGRDALLSRLDAEADRAYDAARQIASDPANVRPVQQGSKQVNTAPSIEPGMRQVIPVIENIASPVDYRAAKLKAAALKDAIDQELEPAQRETYPAYRILRSIATSKDYVPLTTAIDDAAAIQRLGYNDMPSLRSRSEGIAASVGATLRDAVDQAARDSGAFNELQQGRQAAAAKFQARDILNSTLKDEPVQTMRSLVQTKDGSISALREIQRIMPNYIPEIGRATIEGILQDSTDPISGLRGAGAARAWNNLGASTKALLFGGPLTQTLNNFFNLAKLESRDFQPSGTTKAAVGTGSVLGLGEMAIRGNPGMAAGITLSLPVLARMLYNDAWAPMVVRAMTTRTTAARAAGLAKALGAIAVAAGRGNPAAERGTNGGYPNNLQ